ncbi:MAG: hypothetical protein Q9168_003369 [Polycauliona sp. 1 TL-2023]
MLSILHSTSSYLGASELPGLDAARNDAVKELSLEAKAPQVAPRASATSTTEAWRVLHAYLRPQDDDARFWWEMTGPALAMMMHEAAYTMQDQFEGLLFHYRFVVTRLGPCPRGPGLPVSWKSFMTDDFTPVELSWNWDLGGSKPKIRYSVEPISAAAGSSLDPLNQAATMDMVRQLAIEKPEIDWQWFNEFTKSFQADSHSGKTHAILKDRSPQVCDPASVFLAFELLSQGVATKAYFVPVKAEQLGISRMSVVIDGIRALEGPSLAFPALDVFSHFALHDTRQSSIDVVLVAIDCVAPPKSRLKLYIRSSETSFDSVCHMLSLGNKLDLPQKALEELKDLWYLALSLESTFPTSQQLPSISHETSGVLYYYDIKAGNDRPEAKVYIPVKHYGKSDEAVARGLVSYLRSRDRGRYVDGFMRVLEGLCAHRGSANGCGVQTYISVALNGGKLQLTSYFSPEVYHEARWTGQSDV